ncbi:MAG: energy transducer TonB [Rudaea sp.]
MKTTTLAALTIVAFAVNTFAAERVHMIAPDQLAQYWLLQSASATQANVPFRGKNLNAPSCAAVAYTVGNDGRTRDIQLEKIVPDGDLAKVAVDVVARMRFAATPQNAARLPVRTYVVMPFNLPDANSANAAERAKRTQALAACTLSGYGEKTKDVVIPIK